MRIYVYICVCCEKRANGEKREYEPEARENSIVGVYTAFTDQVITRNTSHSLTLSFPF